MFGIVPHRLETMRRLIAAGTALAVFVLAGTAIGLSGLGRAVLDLPAPDRDYAWLSHTLAACEEDAVTRPASLNFLIVPLERAKNYSAEWNAKAMAQSGHVLLFGSQDALAALRAGAVRIASRRYVLHTIDVANETTRRWESVVGVARLTTDEIQSDGPFRIGFQIAPDDTDRDWSTITVRGRGTCHWAFALLGE